MRRQKNINLNQKGQAMADYALILALIGIISVVSLNLLGSSIQNSLAGVTDSLSSGSAPGFTPASRR